MTAPITTTAASAAGRLHSSFARVWASIAVVLFAPAALAPAALAPAALAEDSGDAWRDSVYAASAKSSAKAEQPERFASRAITAAKPRLEKPARLGGPAPSAEPEVTDAKGSLSGGSVTWQASSGCVPGQLKSVINALVANFGPVTVTSTCRSRSANQAAGGAGQSYHLSGEAVDFRVSGGTGAVYAFLSNSGNVGGLKHYGGGLFHIDTGPRRSW